MKLKHYILFALFIGLFTTCKKFPEDPFISLNTVKDRLKGTWKIESILHNGNEITTSYNDTVKPHLIKDLIFNFEFSRKSAINNNNNIVNDFVNYNGYLTLYFKIEKKKIFFTNNLERVLNKLFLSSEYFDIQKLYKGTFKIKNDNFEITLKKTKSN